MKYCKNCGMLLEDTQEICIGCGIDVSNPDNTSLFPLEVAERMESRKEQDKKKTGIIVAIIIVFVLLAVLIGVIAVIASKNAPIPLPESETSEIESEDASGEAEEIAGAEEKLSRREEEDAIRAEEAEEAEENQPIIENRKISDERGTYYNIGEAYDEAGTLMFSTLYPEEFTEPVSTFDYEKLSEKFPLNLNFTVSDKDGVVRLSYTSPSHYWYMKSSATGIELHNKIDTSTYMTYYKYESAQSYVEALIKQNPDYSGAKLELVEERDAASNILESLNQLLNNKTKILTGDIGDYARLGTSTVYSVGESACEAKYLKYVIKTKGGEIYADFYIPLISNSFSFTNDALSDKGTVNEWFPLCVISYESGNKEKYNYYEEAFTVFVNNSVLSKDFFRFNEAYGEIIATAIDSHTQPKAMSKELITSITEDYDQSSQLTDINEGIYNLLQTPENTLKTFKGGESRVTGTAESAQAFYSSSEKSVFITPSADEYPGNKYMDMTIQ